MSDKPLPSGRMRDELVRLSIRTLGKDNGNEHVERTLGVRMSVEPESATHEGFVRLSLNHFAPIGAFKKSYHSTRFARLRTRHGD